MTKLQEMLEVLSAPNYRAMYLKARATSTCMRCGRLVKAVEGRWEDLEYKCSALCRNCRDYYISNAVERERD